MKPLLTLLCLGTFSWSSLVGLAQPTAQAVATAELAFADKAKAEGIRPAFMAYLADSCLLFDSKLVKGKTYYSNASAVPGSLLWAPRRVGISAAGNWGYSTGPYFVTPLVNGEPPATGSFLSIWKKDSLQGWQVWLDVGCPHSLNKVQLDSNGALVTPLQLDAGPRLKPIRQEEAYKSLLDKEKQLVLTKGKLAGVNGATEFIVPNRGVVNAKGFNASSPVNSSYTWQGLGVEVSPAGDLGMSYGLVQGFSNAKNNFYYVRIWRRMAKGWHLELQLLHPTGA